MLLNLAHCDLPATPQQLFDREAPMVLEVGFGDGRFTAHLARTYPDWNILGAEISLASVTRAVKRMRREGLQHVKLYRGQGRFVVHNLMAPRSLQAIYVNFPDPWPRKRHHKNRLLQADFFRMSANRLVDGGTLQLTTDHAGYFAFACEQGTASGCFRRAEGPPPPATLRTKYALKWQSEARPIYHVTFHKTGEDGLFPPTIEKVPMQHALLEGNLADIHDFDKVTHRYRGGHVIILGAYRALSRDHLMFQVLISEDGSLQQDVLIEARPKGDGILVGLSRFGDPLSTRGGREAVKAVSAWLEGQGLKMVQQWL